MKYWISLNKIYSQSPVKISDELKNIKDAKILFEKSKNYLIQNYNISANFADKIKNFSNHKDSERELKFCEKNNIKIIRIIDKDYPYLLKNIPNPPFVLYVRGNISSDFDAISIVGSRKFSQYGERVCKNFSKAFSELGIYTISGMAYGIDSICHNETIENMGKTIAVLGSGVDVIYPKTNKQLYEKIMKNGAVISEFPIGCEPHYTNFPKRNRIISGLSLGTIVIEAEFKSGALITARYALEQNRETFAVCGSIFSKSSAGTNMLIKNSKAKLVENINDVIVEIFPNLLLKGKTKKEKNVNVRAADKKVYNILSDNPIHLDDICEKTQKSVSEISNILLNLELDGLISEVNGKRYIKNN